MKLNIKIGKIGESVTVDTAKLPQASIDYLIEYGLKQSLNDVHASLKIGEVDKDQTVIDEAHILGVVQDRLDKILAGTPPSAGMGGGRLTELEKELRTLVVDLLVKAGNKKAEAVKIVGANPKAAFIDLVTTIDPKAETAVLWEKMIDRAQAVVDARNKPLDLGALIG